MRWWAMISGVTGLTADLLLVAFYAVAQPWTDTPRETWLGTANDYVTIVQFAALIPVALALAAYPVWRIVGVAACAVVVVFQVLLVTGAMPFETQVGFVSVAAVAAMLWAGVVSRRLPQPAQRLGRILLVGVPLALVVFVAGALVTILADIDWAWVAGGAIAVIVWFIFPLWAVVLGLRPPPPAASGEAEGAIRFPSHWPPGCSDTP
jgi:hypothetical protein